jgi:hypothetical protein
MRAMDDNGDDDKNNNNRNGRDNNQDVSTTRLCDTIKGGYM